MRGLTSASSQRGFTLLEILVAMAIFSIVAYMAYGGFSAVLKQQQIVEENSARLRAVQFAVRQLDSDFRQVQPRPAREELGEGWRNALLADTRELQAGEILVCPSTNPSWAPVFTKIKAAVTDIGGLTSHAAIVCREYGVPSVTGTGVSGTSSRLSRMTRHSSGASAKASLLWASIVSVRVATISGTWGFSGEEG